MQMIPLFKNSDPDLKKQEVETCLSVIKDSNQRNSILNRIADLAVVPPTKQHFFELQGPIPSAFVESTNPNPKFSNQNKSSDQKVIHHSLSFEIDYNDESEVDKYQETKFQSFVAGKSISTYPITFGTKQRSGTPICDRFFSRHFPGMIVCALADGCGWGLESRVAATRAAHSFIDFMTSARPNFTSTKEVAKYLLRGFNIAHESILVGKDVFECGTTTLVGGVLLPLDPKEKMHKKYVFTFANIGDCKAYRYCTMKDTIIDMTVRARPANNVSDCGGRLGPFVPEKGSEPDLGNLTVDSMIVDEGDIIWLVSDGVHDNIDPRLLGNTPMDLGCPLTFWPGDEPKRKNSEPIESKRKNSEASGYSLSSFSSNEMVRRKDSEVVKPFALKREKDIDWEIMAGQTKIKWSERFMHDLLEQNQTNGIHPSSIVSILLAFSKATTQNQRTWMETKGQQYPNDYINYPGKMDHTTCLAFTVGNVDDFEFDKSLLQNRRSDFDILYEKISLGIPCKLKKVGTKSPSKCFLGSEGIDYLVNSLSIKTRETAISIMNYFLALGLISHINHDFIFKDEDIWYKFNL